MAQGQGRMGHMGCMGMPRTKDSSSFDIINEKSAAASIDDLVDVGEVKDSLFDAVAANEWA